MEVTLIAAIAENDVIGKDGEMPWYYSEDLEQFRRRTMGHPVIVGRVTYAAITDRTGGPLDGRTNVVLTRSPDRVDASDPSVRVATTTDEALELARSEGTGQAFVAGGASVYEQFLPRADRLVITEIHDTFDGDTTFPEWEEADWREIERDAHEELSFVTYERESPSTDGP